MGALLKWLPEMAVGVDDMDQAHQWFLAELERLETVPDLQLAAEIGHLTSAMARDFQEEEFLMLKIGSPDFPAHCEQHRRVLEAFADIDAGDYASLREVLAMMPRWFLFHLTAMDLPLAIAVRSASGASSETPSTTIVDVALSQRDSSSHFYRSRDSPPGSGPD